LFSVPEHSCTEDQSIVSTDTKGLRGLLIAIVVIVLSAGAVAAASPNGHAANGLATAADKAGKTVPVAAQGQEGTNEDTGGDVEDEANQPETTDDTGDTGDHCATDPRTLDDAALAALNHGAIVCWAAHQDTPEGFDNHGAWVSSWAKDNHGHADSGDAAAGAASTGRGHAKSGNGHAGD
jgi:hypothetical protein